MADKPVLVPHGHIDIVKPLTNLHDGNRLLEDAGKDAERQAKAQGRTLSGEWGTRREGENIHMIFPLMPAEPGSIEVGNGEPLMI